MRLRTDTMLRAAFLMAALFVSATASAQELVLRAEFWAESEPLPALPTEIDGPETQPRIPDKVAQALLAEARRVFSAMIWGYDFVYVPYDKTRKVDEIFELTPRGEIPWGDPRLTTAETRSVGTQLRAYLEYRPDEIAARHRASWASAPYESAQGTGDAPVSNGTEARNAAMDEAAKEALRALLRPIVLNKPREIRGSFAYDQAPRILIRGGTYVAILKIRVQVTEVRGYAAY